MKESFISIILLISINTIFGQSTNNKSIHSFKTSKYSGVYSYGNKTSPSGKITVYAESDDTILFYLDISRGAPSYNMGNLYARVKIRNGYGVYDEKYEEYENHCKFSFTFSKDKLTIKTIGDGYDCGFGGNVISDGEFYKINKTNSNYFIDMTGKKYFFTKTKPEDYAKILK